MTSYLYLLGAVTFEVSGTLLLPLSDNFTKILPTACLAICYLISFYFLTFAIKTIPISIVYASWSGLGVFFISLLGYLFFRQQLTWQCILGLILIVSGVFLVNVNSGSQIPDS